MKIFLLTIILFCSGCASLGLGDKAKVPEGEINVLERMGQAQELGNCQPAAIYEEKEEGTYKKSHKFAMICK